MTIPKYLEETSVEEILDLLNIEYKIRGNYAQGCCPFHQETNPSWGASLTNGAYTCFSCGAKGNLWTLAKHKGFDLYKLLDFKSNINYFVPSSKQKIKIGKEFTFPEIEVKGKILSPYGNRQVMEKLISWGISNSFIDTFEVGYFTYCEINGTKMWNRIIFPVKYEGQIVNYECRDFTGNSARKVLYPKGLTSDYLFNWDNVDHSKIVYVVEGIKGLAKFWNVEKNVVSTFSKNIKDRQKKLFLKLKEICIVPDNDFPKNDTLFDTVEQFDEFLQNEFFIGEILKEGADPNDLTLEEIKKVIVDKYMANEYFTSKYPGYERRKKKGFGLFEGEEQ